MLVERSQRLDKALSNGIGDLSRSRAKALIEQGQVTLDDVVVTNPSSKARAGTTLRVDVPDAQPIELTAEDLGLEILFQDAHVAVVVKPAGLVSHPSKGHWNRSLVHGLLHALDGLSGIGGQERPGIVHRLDKGTSGVMVVAKNDAAHLHLREQFSAHTVERRYWALIQGCPQLDAGRVESYLGRAENDRFRVASVDEDRGKRALTWWQTLERFERAALLECRLETGRTHQVRVHMAEQNWPILADPLYTRRRTPPKHLRDLIQGVDHQLLHARVLAFTHPQSNERLHFEVEPPADFQAVLDGLRAHAAAS